MPFCHHSCFWIFIGTAAPLAFRDEILNTGIAPKQDSEKIPRINKNELGPRLDLPAAPPLYSHKRMKTKPATPSVDAMFRAFSDRTRLRILHMLRGGELCVCDIVAVLEVPQPKASRHLAYLRKAGLVQARKEGLWSYYKL